MHGFRSGKLTPPINLILLSLEVSDDRITGRLDDFALKQSLFHFDIDRRTRKNIHPTSTCSRIWKIFCKNWFPQIPKGFPWIMVGQNPWMEEFPMDVGQKKTRSWEKKCVPWCGFPCFGRKTKGEAFVTCGCGQHQMFVIILSISKISWTCFFWWTWFYMGDWVAALWELQDCLIWRKYGLFRRWWFSDELSAGNTSARQIFHTELWCSNMDYLEIWFVSGKICITIKTMPVQNWNQIT